ncbi:vomeronasal type-1 receptor 4-like [Dromiciops gliroides]|uniref:vomeronasal type-1 receptor 4-like n=1 Tax=Dromiciops gliroides TaxID=33562 RepID=UPI001CC6176A|nr:vomeronasal type-1 receptor 4-like [Dromiciops gliroides]
MPSFDDIFCSFFIPQIIIGVLGNGFLLLLYGSNLITCKRTRPIYVIFFHLAFSNILMILFRGIPWAIQICIQIGFLGDIGCKIIVYLQRVSRGLSLGTTCLMSFFQAITITSCSSKWAELKARASQYTVQSCVFIWVLNLFIDVIVPFYVTGATNSTSSMLNRNLGYCSISKYVMTTSKLVIWKSLYDAVFVVFMAISSSYIVWLLYRHQRQVQHIHDISLNPSASPENRATKVILFLVSIFVFFYSVSSIFVIVMDNSKDTNQWMVYMSVFFTLCYPTASPFVLVSSDSQILNCNAFTK